MIGPNNGLYKADIKADNTKPPLLGGSSGLRVYLQVDRKVDRVFVSSTLLRGTVALSQRVTVERRRSCCRVSEAPGEFGERDLDPIRCGNLRGEFVVAAPQVLHERVTIRERTH